MKTRCAKGASRFFYVHGWTVCRQCRSNCRRCPWMDGMPAMQEQLPANVHGWTVCRPLPAIHGLLGIGAPARQKCRSDFRRCRFRVGPGPPQLAMSHPGASRRLVPIENGGPRPTLRRARAGKRRVGLGPPQFAIPHPGASRRLVPSTGGPRPTLQRTRSKARRSPEKAILATRQRRRDRFWLRCSKILRRIPRFQARVFSVAGFISSGEFA